MLKALLLASAFIALPAAAQDASPKADTIILATFKDASGTDKGTAEVNTEGATTMLTVDVTGMTPGWHGIHFHAKGECNGADKFKSAGPHATKTDDEHHGAHNTGAMHEGDLPNLWVAADGTGKAQFFTPFIDQRSIVDADGTALVVHAASDDLKTDPSGNSGDRIACAVLSKPAP